MISSEPRHAAQAATHTFTCQPCLQTCVCSQLPTWPPGATLGGPARAQPTAAAQGTHPLPDDQQQQQPQQQQGLKGRLRDVQQALSRMDAQLRMVLQMLSRDEQHPLLRRRLGQAESSAGWAVVAVRWWVLLVALWCVTSASYV